MQCFYLEIIFLDGCGLISPSTNTLPCLQKMINWVIFDMACTNTRLSMKYIMLVCDIESIPTFCDYVVQDSDILISKRFFVWHQKGTLFSYDSSIIYLHSYFMYMFLSFAAGFHCPSRCSKNLSGVYLWIQVRGILSLSSPFWLIWLSASALIVIFYKLIYYLQAYYLIQMYWDVR